MESLFSIGQKVCCICSKGDGILFGEKNPLIEGKTYTVTDNNFPHRRAPKGVTLITLKEFGISACFNQLRFVPESFDKQADEAIRESLNESIKVRN